MTPWEEHTVDRNNVVVLNAPLAWCEWMRETIGGTKCCGERWMWTPGWLNLTPLCSLYKVTATGRRLLNTTMQSKGRNRRDVLINTAPCSHPVVLWRSLSCVYFQLTLTLTPKWGHQVQQRVPKNCLGAPNKTWYWECNLNSFLISQNIMSYHFSHKLNWIKWETLGQNIMNQRVFGAFT